MWNVHASGTSKASVIATAQAQLGDIDQAPAILALIADKVNQLPPLNDHQSIDIYSSGAGVIVEATVRTIADGLEPQPVAETPPVVA